MDGIADPQTAAQIARIHAAIMQLSWRSEEWARDFADLQPFEQLRLNPYYEVTASRHPRFASYFDKAIERCRNQRVCLVHGDWSPKNMMVSGENVMAIDFEVVHFGDPSFDSAFLLNHLVLKSFHRPGAAISYQHAAEAYWTTLLQAIPQAAEILQSGTMEQLPLLMLARIDGKSPAEYIKDLTLKQRIRKFAQSLLEEPVSTIAGVFERIRGENAEPFHGSFV